MAEKLFQKFLGPCLRRDAIASSTHGKRIIQNNDKRTRGLRQVPMRPGGGGDQQEQREQFEKEKQRQLQAMNFCAAGFGLDVKVPQQKAGNLAAAKTIPQNINRRERRHGGQRDQGERICQKWNHLNAIGERPTSNIQHPTTNVWPPPPAPPPPSVWADRR